MAGKSAVDDPRFAHPVWFALCTEQAGLAIGDNTAAMRFGADVIPFGGVRSGTAESMEVLRDLLAPGEPMYLTGEADEFAEVSGLRREAELPGLQMHFTGLTVADEKHEDGPEIEWLSSQHAPEMVQLTDIAFPGFFRARTHVLGRYFGIRARGELVAMAGERFAVPGWREVSAVCTHPEHTGRGYAARLIRHVMHMHAAEGLGSFLHLAETNARALALYERLGFKRTRRIMIQRFRLA